MQEHLVFVFEEGRGRVRLCQDHAWTPETLLPKLPGQRKEGRVVGAGMEEQGVSDAFSLRESGPLGGVSGR